MPVSPQADFVTERFGKRLPEGDADVFDGMMSIDVGIAVALDGQIDQCVCGKEGQHVVEKAESGRDFWFSGSIELERQCNLRFVGISDNGSGALRRHMCHYTVNDGKGCE